jgi:hypothetical protein
LTRWQRWAANDDGALVTAARYAQGTPPFFGRRPNFATGHVAERAFMTRRLRMQLTTEELQAVQAAGLYVTEKCDACGTILNQSCRYTILNKPEVYCSADCRDRVFFGEAWFEKRRLPAPARQTKCANCGGSMEDTRNDAKYCSDKCRKRHHRRGRIGKSPGTLKKPVLSVRQSHRIN